MIHLVAARVTGLPWSNGALGAGGPWQTAAHQQEMHGQPGRLLLADGDGVAAETVDNVDPVVAEAALRLFDNRQCAGGLERALDDQRRCFAGVVMVVLRRDGHRLGGGLQPGDGGFARHEQVDAHRLRASDLVGGRDLDQVDTRLRGAEMDGLGCGRAGDLALLDCLVDDLGLVFGRSLGEVAGLQDGVPLAVHQLDRHRQAGDFVAVAVQCDHLRLDGADLREVTRDFHAQHEGRQRRDALRAADLQIVVARDRRLDQVLPWLRRRLDGWVEGQLRRTARIRLSVAAPARESSGRWYRRRSGCRS